MTARPAAGLLVALALAGCAWGGGPQQRADEITQAECNRRADQIYGMRHPEQIYAQDTFTSSLRDAPLSTSGSPSNPTEGLSSQYERAQIVEDCIRGNGPVGPTPAAPGPVAGSAPAQ